MNQKLRYTFAFLFCFLIENSSFSAILSVPSQFATIQSAVNTAAVGDTVLLSPGTYRESVSNIDSTIMFCSPWLFTNDSSFIEQTRWGGTSSRIFTDTISFTTISFAGISFIPNLNPAIDDGIIISSSDSISFQSCYITGTFGSNFSTYYGLIHLNGFESRLRLEDCRVVGDFVGKKPVAHAVDSPITLINTIVRGRTDQRVAAFRGRGNSLISGCVFDNQAPNLILGGAFLIENCHFTQVGNYAISGTSGVQMPDRHPAINHCIFENGVFRNEYSFIQVDLQSMNERFIVSNSTFRNLNSTTSSRAILSNNTKMMLSNNRFENISGFRTIVEGYRISTDSTIFLNNQSPIFVRRDWTPNDSLTVSNCDFIGNSIFTDSLDIFAVFDTVDARMCYWGYPTGPNHPQNPGGHGMVLPNYVNPFPFRTTPVFPENGISDPGNRVTYSLPNSLQFSLYPNPTNASTTIRFAVPIASPMRGELYDRTGRLVTGFTIDQKYFSHGQYPIQLVDTPSGLYFVRLSSSQASTTQPLVIVK